MDRRLRVGGALFLILGPWMGPAAGSLRAQEPEPLVIRSREGDSLVRAEAAVKVFRGSVSQYERALQREAPGTAGYRATAGKLADAYRELGVALIQANRSKEAVEALDSSLRISREALGTDNAESLSARSLAYLRDGRKAEAIPDLERALALRDNYEDRMQLAIALDETGQDDRALAQYGRLLAQNPRDVWVSLKTGFIYTDQKRHAEAVDAYQTAIASLDELPEDTHATAYNNLGDAYLHLCKAQEAVAALTRAAELNPAFADNLGTALLGNPQCREQPVRAEAAIQAFQRAIGHYEKALQTETPGTPGFLATSGKLAGASKGLGLAFIQAGQPKEAIDALGASLAISREAQGKDDAEALSARSHAYLLAGRKAEAIPDLEQALALRDSSEDRLRLAMVLDETGQGDRALEQYERLLAQSPGDAGVQLKIGFLLTGQKRYAEAAETYQKAIARIAELPENVHAAAYNNLGDAYLHLCKRQDAIAALSKAAALSPAFADNLGTALLGNPRCREPQGPAQAEAAVQAFRNAITYSEEALRKEAPGTPGDLTARSKLAGAHQGLGVALLQAGQVKEAVAALDAAVKLNEALGKDDADSLSARARALIRDSRKAEAIPDLERALALRDDYEDRRQLAVALDETGQDDRALEEYGRLLDQNAKDAWVRLRVGSIFSGQKRYTEAADAYQQVVANLGQLPESTHATVYNNLGDAYFHLCRRQEAIAAMTKAAALNPAFAANLEAAIRSRPRCK